MAKELMRMRPLQGTKEQKLEQIRREHDTLVDALNRRLGEMEKEIEKLKKGGTKK